MDADAKARALEKVRRRGQTATNVRDRIYWDLVARMIETNSTIDHFGHVVDEAGEAWSYCIAVESVLSEPFGCGLPLIQINRVRGSMEALEYYEKLRNKGAKIDHKQKDICTDRICKAVLLQ